MRNQTEAFCNKVAAEVLVPEKKFRRDWQSTNTNAVNLKRIVRFNKVSNMVALRRASISARFERTTSSEVFEMTMSDSEN